ncbi:SPOR domain-containing protein [PVC group bacterium]|nr:SPOR domain-containing protein [PVC group bacterium]
MNKSWFTWVFIAAVVVTVLIAFNYQGGKDAVPLSEIFPDEETMPVGVEYEYVQEEVVSSKIKEGLPIANENRTTPSVELESISLISKNISTEKNFNYTIQIASFKDEKRAEQALTQIRTKVPSAYISTQNLGSNGVWHRIYAGQFELRSEAEVTLSNVKQNYDGSFIMSPKRAK